MEIRLIDVTMGAEGAREARERGQHLRSRVLVQDLVEKLKTLARGFIGFLSGN